MPRRTPARTEKLWLVWRTGNGALPTVVVNGSPWNGEMKYPRSSWNRSVVNSNAPSIRNGRARMCPFPSAARGDFDKAPAHRGGLDVDVSVQELVEVAGT